jgi:hypothetical protein
VEVDVITPITVDRAIEGADRAPAERIRHITEKPRAELRAVIDLVPIICPETPRLKNIVNRTPRVEPDIPSLT